MLLYQTKKAKKVIFLSNHDIRIQFYYFADCLPSELNLEFNSQVAHKKDLMSFIKQSYDCIFFLMEMSFLTGHTAKILIYFSVHPFPLHQCGSAKITIWIWSRLLVLLTILYNSFMLFLIFIIFVKVYGLYFAFRNLSNIVLPIFSLFLLQIFSLFLLKHRN